MIPTTYDHIPSIFGLVRLIFLLTIVVTTTYPKTLSYHGYIRWYLIAQKSTLGDRS